MSSTSEDRLPSPVRDFRHGIILKNEFLGAPGLLRLTGLKHGKKEGVLVSRGGFDDWDDAATDWRTVNGIKRWYREDGGVNLIVEGNIAGTRRLRLYNQNNKTTTDLLAIGGGGLPVLFPYDPDIWVDCGKQLILIPGMSSGRPHSIKLNHIGNGGGLRVAANGLGLDPPTTALFVTAIGVAVGNNPAYEVYPSQITEGTYLYGYTYCYGTKDDPLKYGESALSPLSYLTFDRNSLSAPFSPSQYTTNNGIIQISGWNVVGSSPFHTKIRIYRSKVGSDVLYRIGEIIEPGLTNWNDTIGDSLIDESLTPPTETGLPTGMICALWHPGFQRLYWFGVDGYFHWSAATYPDINPANNRMAVGDTGYRGFGIGLIRNNIYCFKEDGIFLVSGTAPNYYSVDIDGTQCKSRSTVVRMPDGIYFLGSDGSSLRVFRFDGNRALPISGAIDDLIPDNQDSVIRKAFARRVGDEYWLSLMVNDVRYTSTDVPFNNVVFAYNYLKGSWSDFPAQASVIEYFDGPGNKGEIFIGESDPITDANKGNFFKLREHSNKASNTDYSSGARVYTKALAIPGKVTLGPYPGINKRTQQIEKIDSYQITARMRAYYTLPEGNIYKDDLGLTALESQKTSDDSEEKLELTLTGDAASVLGVGKLGTMTLAPRLVEDFRIPASADLTTGLIAELVLDRSERHIEVMAVDFVSSSSDNE